ncbi:MAG: transglycosylase domain-containing protein [Lewinellaceae bacterium]|nr:transglycosylase domain-containing protein [Lewinellaceae bacterium]
MEPQSLLSLKARLQKQRMPLYRKLVKAFWVLAIGALASVLLVIVVINFTAIPSFRELEDPQSALASDVLAADGTVLGRYFIENRVPVDYEHLNPNIINALVATEDIRFRDHCGVDSRAVLRVIVRTILLSDQSAGGGSTITQQLAKNLYSDRNFEGLSKIEKLFGLIYRKLREWITAVKLEKSYTKEEIMAMYLNQVDFVNNAYGIESAAEVYFGTGQEKLKIEEAATLVGMLQNPSRYNPLRFPQRCIRRRMIVLYQMWQAGFITEEQYNTLKVVPLDMGRFHKVTFSDDTAPYLCAELKKDVQQILDQPESRKPDGTKYNIYKEGLKIYTTIDPAYQAAAEAAMQEQMRTMQRRFFQVWKGRDPWTYKTSSATDEEIQQRKASLMALVRDGDRYQETRPLYLDDLDNMVQEKYGIPLRDADIIRMLGEEQTKGSISKLVGKGWATADQAAAYRSIMRSDDWALIKKKWSALQAAVLKQYNTKVKMRVFSWDGRKLERDTVMSPMDSLKYHRMFLQTGVLAVDPLSSEIKAWVGGINFKYFKYDHIRSPRQVGSTFKPFVYGTAIALQGISPCYQIYDNPVTIPAHYGNFKTYSDWTPRNSTGTYSGQLLTLKEGLKHSVNTISASLMKQMGDTRPVRGLVNNMGIDSSHIPNAPSICLGAADISVMEMTGAYATFANNGVFGKPYVIRRIEDKNGRVLYENLPEERQALPANANFVMTEMLKYNVAGSPGINKLKSEVGGKTGTTNDYTDGWFMGVTPRLVVGTWVGGEDRWIRFLSLSDGQGSRMARPIFAGFMQRLENDKNSGYDFNARFQRPAGDLGIEIDCSAYLDQLPASDEEEYQGEIYNDQLPANGKPTDAQKPAKRPDATFGDERR